MSKPGESLAGLVELMQTLLGPNGCPWDREQTLESLSGYLLEETYEVNDFKKGLFYEQYYPGMTTFADQMEPRQAGQLADFRRQVRQRAFMQIKR